MQAISHLTRQSFSLLVIKYILEVILLDFKFAIIESVIYQKLAELTQVYLEAVMHLWDRRAWFRNIRANEK